MCSLALTATCAMFLASNSKPTQQMIFLHSPGSANNVIGGAASVGFSLRFLSEGESVWNSDSTWTYVPSWLELANTAASDGYLLEKGTTIEYRCPNAVAECELFVFQYRCNGCRYIEGGLPAFLQGDGWTSFSCAPKFRINSGSQAHPMLGFRLVVDSSTVTELKAPADMEYVAFAMDVKYTACDSFNKQADCDASSERCEWDNGVCEFRTCGPRSIGPSLPLSCSSHCVGLDLN